GHVGVEVDAAAGEIDAAHRAEAPAAVRQVALLEDGADGIQDAALRVEHETLAADAEHDDRVGHPGRHLSGEVQPGAVEHPAPAPPGPDRPKNLAPHRG